MLSEEQWKQIDTCIYCGAKLMEMDTDHRINGDDPDVDCWHHFPDYPEDDDDIGI